MATGLCNVCNLYNIFKMTPYILKNKILSFKVEKKQSYTLCVFGCCYLSIYFVLGPYLGILRYFSWQCLREAGIWDDGNWTQISSVKINTTYCIISLLHGTAALWRLRKVVDICAIESYKIVKVILKKMSIKKKGGLNLFSLESWGWSSSQVND